MNYIDLYNDGSQSPLSTTRGMDIWLFLETFTVVTVAYWRFVGGDQGRFSAPYDGRTDPPTSRNHAAIMSMLKTLL